MEAETNGEVNQPLTDALKGGVLSLSPSAFSAERLGWAEAPGDGADMASSDESSDGGSLTVEMEVGQLGLMEAGKRGTMESKITVVGRDPQRDKPLFEPKGGDDQQSVLFWVAGSCIKLLRRKSLRKLKEI